MGNDSEPRPRDRIERLRSFDGKFRLKLSLSKEVESDQATVELTVTRYPASPTITLAKTYKEGILGKELRERVGEDLEQVLDEGLAEEEKQRLVNFALSLFDETRQMISLHTAIHKRRNGHHQQGAS